jgi:hypothetical protein
MNELRPVVPPGLCYDTTDIEPHKKPNLVPSSVFFCCLWRWGLAERFTTPGRDWEERSNATPANTRNHIRAHDAMFPKTLTEGLLLPSIRYNIQIPT